MQDRLFDHVDIDEEDDNAESAEADPYESIRLAGQRLAKEFEIDDGRAADMVLSFGSEAAARRVLVQRWLLGEEQSKAA